MNPANDYSRTRLSNPRLLGLFDTHGIRVKKSPLGKFALDILGPIICYLGLIIILGLVLGWPTSARAYEVSDLRLHINDANIGENERVRASVQFCVRQVPPQNSRRNLFSRKVVIPIQILVNDWPHASDCRKVSQSYEHPSMPSQPTAQAVQPNQPICSRKISVELPSERGSAFVCTKVLPICEFFPSTHKGLASNPSFLACAKDSDNTSVYSGSVSVLIDGQSTRQAATSSRLNLELARVGTKVLITNDRPAFALRSGSFLWQTDPRTTTVEEIQTMAGVMVESMDLGTWKFVIKNSEPLDLSSREPLVQAIVRMTDPWDFEPNEYRYSEISLAIRDIVFFDQASFSVPTSDELGSFLSIGTDQDNDGILDVDDDDRDGDGFLDTIDVFPTRPGEHSDDDRDRMGDNFEIQHFGDLNQAPDADWDQDGMTNRQEYASRTDPESPDSDLDLVLDGQDMFPLDSEFSQDVDGDYVPDPLDAFPWDPSSGRDRDHDGLPDAFESFWFTSIESVEALSDPDHDRISVIDEWKTGTSPLSTRTPRSFLGGGEGESQEIDALIVPISILNEAPSQIAADPIGVVSNEAEIEFLISESADFSTIKLYWNGSNLIGADGIVNSGDEAISSLIIDWSRSQRRIRISGLFLPTGYIQELRVQVASALNPQIIDRDRYTFFHGNSATGPSNRCQITNADSIVPSLVLLILVSFASSLGWRPHQS